MKITVSDYASCAHTALISFSLIAFELHASGLYLVWVIFAFTVVLLTRTSPWPIGKCVRFGAGRSRVRLSAGSYQDLVNWCCSLLTRRTVCGRAAGNTLRTQNRSGRNETEIVQTQSWRYKTFSCYKVPTTNHHNKQTSSTVNMSFLPFPSLP